MTTLNSIQQHSYSIAHQLARFLRKSKRIYHNATPFRNEVTTFLSNFDKISEQATIKAKKGNAVTVQKRELKKEIAYEAAQICTLTTAYALTTNNIQLHYNINKTYTDIYTTKDIILKGYIAFITSVVEPLLQKEDFKEYGITAASLASITGKAEQFYNMISTAKWINWESDQASRNITATLKKIKTNIKQLSRLLILFNETNPSFIQDFRQSLIITQKDKAHNTLEGTITNSNTTQPLEGATITIEGSTKTAITNILGFYHFTGIKVGTHKITITAGGYSAQTIEVKIIRGKTITQNIHLAAKSFTLPVAEVA